ncbi:MAG: Gfo/Idh/MocA family oxidoreductase [Pirellula sp.]
MNQPKFAFCGAGFWANFQLAAWNELDQARCVAICDPDLDKASKLANRFGVPKVYRDAKTMLSQEAIDFVDIVSSPNSHDSLVRLAAARKLPTICQKPLTEDWDSCSALVKYCQEQGSWMAVHENWRWQRPLRYVASQLSQGAIGRVLRCRMDMITGFNVFANQPTLAKQKRFIIVDLGCHLLDYARFLFGEASILSCFTSRSSPEIVGENVATILMKMGKSEIQVLVEVAYANTPIADDCFPQTLMFIEGDQGSLVLRPNFQVDITTHAGTVSEIVHPMMYDWVDPKYTVVHSSMVECNRNLLDSLRAGMPAETDAADNLRTMQLVFAAYDSSDAGKTIRFDHDESW